MPRRSQFKKSNNKRSNLERSSSVVKSTPPPAINKTNNPSLAGSLLGTVAQGFAFGTGSSMAHRGVDAVIGNNNQDNAIDIESGIKNNNKDHDFTACKIIFQQYQKCLEKSMGIQMPV